MPRNRRSFRETPLMIYRRPLILAGVLFLLAAVVAIWRFAFTPMGRPIERVTPSIRPGLSTSPAPGNDLTPASQGGCGELMIVTPKGRIAGQCPLKHTDVDADIAGFVARVQVRQEFYNPSPEPVEAIYTFPLPDDAAVDDMTMTIGRRVITGEIKRREEARQIYEAARASGQTAALLDQERPNIFSQSVANVMPGEAITIRISYVHLLKYDAGVYEFSFPMVVGPRYIPGGGSAPVEIQPDPRR